MLGINNVIHTTKCRSSTSHRRLEADTHWYEHLFYSYINHEWRDMLAAIPVCDPAKEMKCAEPLSRRGLNKAQKKTTKLRFP